LRPSYHLPISYTDFIFDISSKNACLASFHVSLDLVAVSSPKVLLPYHLKGLDFELNILGILLRYYARVKLELVLLITVHVNSFAILD
jgi:hypothetical protein